MAHHGAAGSGRRGGPGSPASLTRSVPGKTHHPFLAPAWPPCPCTEPSSRRCQSWLGRCVGRQQGSPASPSPFPGTSPLTWDRRGRRGGQAVEQPGWHRPSISLARAEGCCRGSHPQTTFRSNREGIVCTHRSPTWIWGLSFPQESPCADSSASSLLTNQKVPG